MSNCQITIKINDIFPKIDSLSYDDCKCLISIRNYTSEIYLSNYMNEFFNHQPKIINSDLIYKIKLVDCVTNSLIGGKELIISYDVITQIAQGNPIIYNEKVKLITDTKTKRKIFGSIISDKTIILSLIIEINLVPQNINNVKIKKKKVISKCKSIEDIKNNNIKRNKHKNKLNIKRIIKLKSSSMIKSQKNSNIDDLKERNKSKLFNLKKKKKLLINIIPYKKIEGILPYENDDKNINDTNIQFYSQSTSKDDCITKIMNSSPNNLTFKAKNLNINKNYFILYKNNKKDEKKNKSINKEKKYSTCNIINNRKEINVGNKKIINKKFKIQAKLFVNKIKNNNKIRSKNKSLANTISINSNFKQKYINKKFIGLQKFNTSSSFTINKIKKKDNSFKENYNYRKLSTPKNISNNSRVFNSLEPYISKDKKSNKVTRTNSSNGLISSININSYREKDNKMINNYNNINHLMISNQALLAQLITIFKKNKDLIKKNKTYKEKFLNETKKNKIIEEKNIAINSKKFIFNINSQLNLKILVNLVNIKKIENDIFQKIFNENNNIFNNSYQEKNFVIKNDKISLLLGLVKNCIKNYGDISYIYNNDIIKKIKLQALLDKYNTNEDNKIIKENSNIISESINNIFFSSNNYNKQYLYISKYNKEKIKVIKEEDEEDDEEIELFNKVKNNTNNANNTNKSNKSNKNKNIVKNQKKNSLNINIIKNKKKKEKNNFQKNHYNKNNYIFNNIIINNIK